MQRMPSVRVLPPALASQIAAGEVVERPASAVKELVENALDAGAARVDVEIAGGGITLIRVSDDGRGMGREDAALSVERHATSKLDSAAALERIATFGFRGEALPSIASVSHFALRTRSSDAEEGTEVLIDGGTISALRPVGRPPGTTVEVRDLFYNVPARRKFLRSTGTESGHVTDIVEAAALSRPDVTFTLFRDQRKVREYLRAPTRGERAASVVGEDELAECSGERGPLRVEAHLARPERARTGTAGLRILVNDRPIKDRRIAHTIASAYGTALDKGRYPRGVVHIDVPPELVDVNVHPQKTEVRFAEPRAVSDAIYRILSVALAEAFELPEPGRSRWGSPNTATLPSERVGGFARAPQPKPRGLPGGSPKPAAALRSPSDEEPNHPVVHAARELLELADSSAAEPPRPGMRWAALRFIAQVRHTYLVCEGDDGLYIVDQHAAAARVAFEKLQQEFRERAVASQALLFPFVVDLSEAEVLTIEQRSAEIAKLGIDVRVRGPASVSVHGVPKLLASASPERLVVDLLGELSKPNGAFSRAIDAALASIAMHGAIKAGDVVTPDQARALLSALDKTRSASESPYGRPVLSHIAWSELERRVGRR